MKQIEKVQAHALCTGCGACAGVCPHGAIAMVENPAGFLMAQCNPAFCVDCGLCERACPSLPNEALAGDAFWDGTAQKHKCYLGYAVDSEIRLHAQSGGVVTALLCALMDSNLIDGVVVSRFDQAINRPRSKFVNTKEAVIASSGSCYAQTAVAQTVLESGSARSAAVVLGCQADAICRALPEKNRPLLLGLSCGGQYSAHMIDDLLSRLNICGELEDFRFRDKACGGWPGNVSATTKENVFTLPASERMRRKKVYENFRCVCCRDKLCSHADLVFGDPWELQVDDVSSGFTTVIVRTERGENALMHAARDGKIVLCETPAEHVLNGQGMDSVVRRSQAACSILKKHKVLSPYENGWGQDAAGKRRSYRELKKRLVSDQVYWLSPNSAVAKKREGERKKYAKKANSRRRLMQCLSRIFHR